MTSLFSFLKSGFLKNITDRDLVGHVIFFRIRSLKKRTSWSSPGGDRTDMILASLESDTSGIILTNNILPLRTLSAKPPSGNIPLLMVFSDTYQTAKQIEKPGNPSSPRTTGRRWKC